MSAAYPARRPWYEFIRLAASWILHILARRRVTGLEYLPREGGFMLASNHFSFLEPPIVGACIPMEMHFLAKASLFGIPVLGPLVKSMNSLPIHRGSSDLTGLNRAAQALKDGARLIIFPEGGRNKTGKLKEARGGIGYLALESGVPIIPAYVRNGNQLLKCLQRKATLFVAFGPPLEPDPELLKLERKEAYRRLGRQVMARIAVLEEQVLERESRER